MNLYGTKQWENKRQNILRRDGYLDKLEARYGRRVEAETVHHIFPVEFYPEWRLSSWNLISLSKATHNRLHDRNTGGLTAEGMELARRTARKAGVEVDWERMA